MIFIDIAKKLFKQSPVENLYYHKNLYTVCRIKQGNKGIRLILATEICSNITYNTGVGYGLPLIGVGQLSPKASK